MIVVLGGRAGVGATTVALNLAAVLSDRGDRVLLVDGAQQRNDAIESASPQRDVTYSLSDVLTGKCSAREAIVTGPAGIRLLPNRWNPRSSPDFSRRAQQRLLAELESLDGEFDLIVMDAGRGASSWTQRLWDGARLILLVTTPDDAAVLDAYAALKIGVAKTVELPIRLLVNQAESDAQAADAHRRMEHACQKFLLRSIPALPALPLHMQVFVGPQSSPRVWEMPNTPFGHAALWLGRAVDELLAEERCQVSV
jgi:flagellar biosynthesis protein FlhG